MSACRFILTILSLSLYFLSDSQEVRADPELFQTFVSPAPVSSGFYGASVACSGATQTQNGPGEIVSGEPYGGANLGGRTSVNRSIDRALIYNESDPNSTAVLGAQVAAVGDCDKNGFQDFIEGAPGIDLARIVLGPNTFSIDLMTGLPGGSNVGSAVAGLFGDVNANGHQDVLIGASTFDGVGGVDTGAVVIVDTQTLSPVGNQVIEGGTDNEKLGTSITSIQDLDGDGVRDIIAGAPGFGSSGAVRILSANSIPVNLTLLPGTSAGSGFGTSVAAVQDLNNDGIDEFVVGAPQLDIGPGKAELYSGGLVPSLLCSLTGENNTDEFGHAVSGLGDIDGDGVPDFAVGAPSAAGNLGKVYIYKYDPNTLSCPLLFSITGTTPGQALGLSLAGYAGGGLNCDFDNDAHFDFVVGSSDDGTSSDEGKVFAYRNITPTPTNTPSPTATATPTSTATPIKPTPTATPSPIATPLSPTSARFNYTISTDGNLSANLTLNNSLSNSSTCRVRILGRRSNFDLTNPGPIRTLVPLQSVESINTRYIARALRKPSSISCEIPYIYHVIAGVNCGAGEFFSNMRSRYLTCGRLPQQPIVAWEEDLQVKLSGQGRLHKIKTSTIGSKSSSAACLKKPSKHKFAKGK